MELPISARRSISPIPPIPQLCKNHTFCKTATPTLGVICMTGLEQVASKLEQSIRFGGVLSEVFSFAWTNALLVAIPEPPGQPKLYYSGSGTSGDLARLNR